MSDGLLLGNRGRVGVAMNKPFEAAVRAGCGEPCDYPKCFTACEACRKLHRRTAKMLAAALPPDPAPSLLETIRRRSQRGSAEITFEQAQEFYHALRASLLPGEV